ncbi:MAG TPA: urate hydroxylase PuuD [Pyrinomonadaceae bacterium]
MLIDSLTHLPTSLAMFRDYVLAPTDSEVLIRTILRWGHIVAGITWIGLLYFFNLVNVNFMKALDGPTKGKVVPELMPRALWWFRWGALFTVLIGLTFFAMYILPSGAQAAGKATGGTLGIWLVIVLVTYAILYSLYRVPALTKPGSGYLLAIVIALLVIAMSVAILYFLGNNEDRTASLGNEATSIAIGGGIGILMMLNVWGIIWPAQKRIIAWTKDNAANGTPIPPESAVLARRSFLASRTNTWLSLPVIFFMSTSHKGEYTLFP